MIVILPIILFVLIYLPYLFLIPGGDGNLEFSLAVSMFQGTFFTHHLIFHPPFKLFLFTLFFPYFGYWSYSLVGLILGCFGIYALFEIAEEIFNKKIALLSSFLLAVSGLYIAVGQPSINDFVMTVMILIAFMFYLRGNYWWYGIFAAIAVLTKETAIFFAVSIIAVELFQKKKHFIPLFLPVISLVLWLAFLHVTGRELWNDYNFSSTKDKGSMYTILHNLVTFGFFNKYAAENWLHLFVFNFNWVYTFFAGIGLFSIKYAKQKKALAVIGIFYLLFVTGVLGFQTWTINRYVLPLLPFLYLFAIVGASRLRYHAVWLTIIFACALLSLSSSIDPVSKLFWPRTTILGEKIFIYKTDGGDGITYNLQYLNLLKKRTAMLSSGQCKMPYLLSYDKDTLKLLQIKTCR